MEPYFTLNAMISDNSPTVEITDFIRDNSISAKTFDRFAFLDCRRANLPCPLTQAALCGRWDVMKALFAVGFDPHKLYGCVRQSYQNRTRWAMCTSVQSAARGGHLTVVKSLVEEYQVDVNAEDGENQKDILDVVLLSLSCRDEDSLPLVRYLVEAGADINAGKWGLKPIHFAGTANRLDIIEYLLSKGATVIDEMKPCGYPLKFLAFETNDMCVNLMLENVKGLSTDEVFDNGQTLLHEYAKCGLTKCVKKLCSLGWNPDAQDNLGLTPLHAVLTFNRRRRAYTMFNIVHFLIIEQNASMDLENTAGVTSFDQAVLLKDVGLVEVFLSAGFPTTVISIPGVQTVLKTLAQENKSIHEILSNPRRLADLCCYNIRRVLGLGLPSAVDSLQLPQELEHFLRLEHVQNCHKYD